MTTFSAAGDENFVKISVIVCLQPWLNHQKVRDKPPSPTGTPDLQMISFASPWVSISSLASPRVSAWQV